MNLQLPFSFRLWPLGCLSALLALLLCSTDTSGTEARNYRGNAESPLFTAEHSPDRSKSSRSRKTLFQWRNETSFSATTDRDQPFATDRPDFTEAATTVGRGVAQIEFGYTYTYNSDNGERTRSQSFGQPLLRYGLLADWLEFRIALFPTVTRITTAGESTTSRGTEDLYIGCKIALTEQQGMLPEMALIPQTNIPTGSGSLSSNELEPGLNWAYAWDVNDLISVAGSTQGNRRIDDSGEAYLEFAQSWTVACHLTDKLGAYTEWFAFFPSGADTAKTQHYGNGGLTWLVSNNMQFDVFAGIGLNDAADDYFFGSGFSLRFGQDID